MPPKKTTQPKTAAPKAVAEHKAAASHARYIEGIGRRKTAVARVRIAAGKGHFIVNDKDVKIYFPMPRLEARAKDALSRLNLSEKFDVSARIVGGGIRAQAEALRHGLSRALTLHDEALRPRLRAFGFLTRDSRMVERKHYGLKKARRAPQWAKR